MVRTPVHAVRLAVPALLSRDIATYDNFWLCVPVRGLQDHACKLALQAVVWPIVKKWPCSNRQYDWTFRQQKARMGFSVRLQGTLGVLSYDLVGLLHNFSLWFIDGFIVCVKAGFSGFFSSLFPYTPRLQRHAVLRCLLSFSLPQHFFPFFVNKKTRARAKSGVQGKRRRSGLRVVMPVLSWFTHKKAKGVLLCLNGAVQVTRAILNTGLLLLLLLHLFVSFVICQSQCLNGEFEIVGRSDL